MAGQQRSNPSPRRPKGKTPAERAADADETQRRLKQEAAERRQAKAAKSDDDKRS
jgi:hypothetical protein